MKSTLIIDYYPFGSEMPGRKFVSGDHYTHKYQGQFTEHDEEVNWDAFELRNWDGRLARWTSTDPAGQFWSPYLGMGNNPINMVDPDGAWVPGAGFFRNLFNSDSKIWAEDYAAANGGYTTQSPYSGNWYAEGQIGDGIGVWAKNFGNKGSGNGFFRSLGEGFRLAEYNMHNFMKMDPTGLGSETAEDVAFAVGNLNPVMGIPNSINVLYNKEDLRGNDASSTLDQVLAGASFLSILGPGARVSKLILGSERLGKAVDRSHEGVQFFNNAGLFNNLKEKE